MSMADSRSLLGAKPDALINAFWAGLSRQLSLMTVGNGAGPCNSRTVSGSAWRTPKAASDGPRARRRRCFGALPVMMKPPMPTLSPVRTNIRVERLSGCAAGEGVAVGAGVVVAVTEGVAVGTGVAV